MDTKGIVENIKAGVSGIHIQGRDFVRVDEEIEEIAKQLKFKVKEWNQGYGWVDFKTKRALKPEQDVSLYEDLKTIADDNPENNIYVIRNAFSALNNDYKAAARLQQELQRINRDFKSQSVIFLIAKEDIVFPEIVDLLVQYHCPPLASSQVETIFDSLLQEHSINASTKVKRSLVSIFSGMERDTMLRIFETLLNKYAKSFPSQAVERALALKKKSLSRSGLLELVDSSVCIDQIGGLQQLKSWLRNKKHIIDNLAHAQRLGISAPKGVLLAGMPGCGKSMSAKAAASLFNVPLFRLDIGSLMGKFVGESEANMKAALKIAEQASPCVLWVDELEKAFSGINGSGGSAEITTRLFGYFLTWMQEKPGAVFVMATANDITSIPPELLRRGRFDEIFYVDLPSDSERKQIFEVKIRALKIEWSKINFAELAKATSGFSGADIECVINDALEDLFRNDKRDLTQDVLKKHISLVTPISLVLEDKIKIYQELFKNFRLKAASLREEDLESINTTSDSQDSSERENAASNEFISPEKLKQLVKDVNSGVRMAAIKNPRCPIEALKEIVTDYKPFDFKKSGSWSDTQVAKEEFDKAVQHPNMTGDLILNLYATGMIKDEELLSLAHKLSSEERENTFDAAKVKLSRSIASATVQNICFLPGDIVNRDDVLVEIDNEEGHTQRVTTSVNGLIDTIFVKVGETIIAGKQIALILVPKS
ncbi:hypothetical protein B5G52_20235 [Pseudoalteromonas sp. A601]|uniref:AAA family ATPase n=1 Tax=Pseudoalteromonas sp. A601 TaxID=1967839 RepID=UPI000B3C2B5A|nr:AAA family ATPase [Pseudoalteromonas sp. A601]OUS68185.1 hypothetical protein B5G52_20235 [Pseudoalteromonas sp. A601]